MPLIGGKIKWDVRLHLGMGIFLSTASIVYSTHCKFRGYLSNCTVLVNNVPIHTIAIINHCHDPIDVTFLLQASELQLDWRHTFVTSNIAEMQTIPDFGEEWQMDLHVALRKVPANKILIQADYHTRRLDNQKAVQLFLNSTVIVNSLADCKSPPGSVMMGLASRVALVVTFVSFLGVFIGGLIIWIFRRQGDPVDQTVLVNDTYVGLPGAVPYQEGAGGEHKKLCLPFRVSFTAKQPAFDTVIENTFVQNDPGSIQQPDTTAKDVSGG